MKRFKYTIIAGAAVISLFLNSSALTKAAVYESSIAMHTSEPEPFIRTLTLEQAVEMAIKNSDALIKMEANVASYKEKETKIQDNYNTSISKTPYIDFCIDMAELEYERNTNTDNMQKEKDSILLTVTNSFLSILNAEAAYTEFIQNLNLEQSKFNITEIKYELGKVSKNDYEDESESLDKLSESKTDYQRSIRDASYTLNRLIGVDLNNRYQLVIETPYQELGNYDLGNYIKEVTKADTLLKQYHYESESNQYAKETYSLRFKDPDSGEVASGADTYDSLLRKEKELELDIIKRGINIEDTVRDTCNKIKDQEKNYMKKQKELKSTNKKLADIKAKYKVGKSTKLDIEAQKLNILKIENEIQSLIYEHYIEVLKLTNPNLTM